MSPLPDDGFAAFMASRQRRLQRAAWLLTGEWAAAEDLAQTALTKTWRRWDRVARADDPDAYVRRVLVNSYLSMWRVRWRSEAPMSEVSQGAPSRDPAEELAMRVAVQAALAQLSRRQRAVVVLRYFDDLSEQQVATMLGCAIGTVKSTTAKALARLRAEPGLAELLEEVQR